MELAVSSPSFSQNALLVEELKKSFPNASINSDGNSLIGEKLVQFLQGADAALIGREPITAEIIQLLPRLRFIAKYGVGLDNIDQESLNLHQIEISVQDGLNKGSVAELILCFMINLTRNVSSSSTQVKKGIWKRPKGLELSGKKVGVIGCGNIGRELIRLLEPFRCPVLVVDMLDKEQFVQEERSKGRSILQTDLKTLLESSDFISLNVSLNPHSQGMIDEKALSRMKKTAYLINTSRGKVIDQEALKKCLQKNQIAGAALDVLWEEPPNDPELLMLPNIMITPHIGGNSLEAILRMGRYSIQTLREYRKRLTRGK